MYEYRAIIREAYDGDTVRADVDLGFGMWMHRQSLRLAGIDAPELRGETLEAGRRSRDFLRALVLGREVRLKSRKTGKYGRWLADLYDDEAPEGPLHVNAEMVRTGHAAASGG